MYLPIFAPCVYLTTVIYFAVEYLPLLLHGQIFNVDFTYCPISINVRDHYMALLSSFLHDRNGILSPSYHSAFLLLSTPPHTTTTKSPPPFIVLSASSPSACRHIHIYTHTYQQSRYWIQYAEFELKHHHFSEVESLFQRCLRNVLSVDLWKYYLNYIRRINTGPESKDIITKSYDFVLQHVGLDRDSGPIWSDYLFFLKSGQVSCPWR